MPFVMRFIVRDPSSRTGLKIEVDVWDNGPTLSFAVADDDNHVVQGESYFEKAGGRLLSACDMDLEYARRYSPATIKWAQRVKNVVQRKLARRS
jgi:hypothetical protein